MLAINLLYCFFKHLFGISLVLCLYCKVYTFNATHPQVFLMNAYDHFRNVSAIVLFFGLFFSSFIPGLTEAKPPVLV